ncbi:MAG: Ppx/GppA phosphatase family protein [Chloroflexi bacterium]|nr:Ppx/GppA phosphatase family protein [Chloroflexota bacterium]
MEGRIAVIDIGSNSGRVVIVQPETGGHLEIIDEQSAPLRLALEVSRSGELSPAAIEWTLHALKDFTAVARGAGAVRTAAVATAAVRRATNGEAFVQRLRDELDLDVTLIDAQDEARLAFLGAVYGLPAEDGFFVDIGGGSLQIVHFANRQPLGAWSIPSGALVLAERLLTSDPPPADERKAAADHVMRALAEARVPPPDGSAQTLVGTGGTIRNLAKIDRRRRAYPIARLHGYGLHRRSLQRIVAGLATQPLRDRAQTPGLNPARADSIVAGGIALNAVMRYLHTDLLTVSGQGLREGIARGAVFAHLPSAQAVREASVEALCRRFADADHERGRRRAQAAKILLDHPLLDIPPPIAEAVLLGARLLDIGSVIDFYNRHKLTAEIVLRTDLNGFSHRDLARLAAVIRLAEKPGLSASTYRPLLDLRDDEILERAAIILALADESVRRTPPAQPVQLDCWSTGPTVHLRFPAGGNWRPGKIGPRFLHAFGRALVLEEPLDAASREGPEA